MKVLLSYPAFQEAVRGEFPDLEVYDGGSGVYDVVVFPGGEDVHPSHYIKDEIQLKNSLLEYGRICYFNEKRDEIELGLLDRVIKGEIKTSFVVGLCRGLQLLNVFFNGGLILDIQDEHPYNHDLLFHNPMHKLGKFKKVNSLHHQGIRYVGESVKIGNREFYAQYEVIASYRNIPEIVLWRLPKIFNRTYPLFFGTQFHPEFFSPDYRSDFFRTTFEFLEEVKSV